MRRAAATGAVLLAVLVLGGCADPEHGPTRPEGTPGRDHCVLTGASDDAPVILFGDLHAHSTNSLDALVMDIPLAGGTADRGPLQRCEFARFCSTDPCHNGHAGADDDCLAEDEERAGSSPIFLAY